VRRHTLDPLHQPLGGIFRRAAPIGSADAFDLRLVFAEPGADVDDHFDRRREHLAAEPAAGSVAFLPPGHLDLDLGLIRVGYERDLRIAPQGIGEILDGVQPALLFLRDDAARAASGIDVDAGRGRTLHGRRT
jgi:hypothetical protein